MMRTKRLPAYHETDRVVQHNWVAGECRWCGMRQHWEGARHGCPGGPMRIEILRQEAADLALSKRQAKERRRERAAKVPSAPKVDAATAYGRRVASKLLSMPTADRKTVLGILLKAIADEAMEVA